MGSSCSSASEIPKDGQLHAFFFFFKKNKTKKASAPLPAVDRSCTTLFFSYYLSLCDYFLDNVAKMNLLA
jgi:hypothetical protein